MPSLKRFFLLRLLWDPINLVLISSLYRLEKIALEQGRSVSVVIYISLTCYDSANFVPPPKKSLKKTDSFLKLKIQCTTDSFFFSFCLCNRWFVPQSFLCYFQRKPDKERLCSLEGQQYQTNQKQSKVEGTKKWWQKGIIHRLTVFQI